MKAQTLVKKYLPQNPDIEVLVPNYKEPILPVNHGGFGWYGLQAYNEQGQLMCHECGEFWDVLGRHIRKHGLHPHEYKAKYGLLRRRSLTSPRAHLKMRMLELVRIEKNPDKFRKAREAGQAMMKGRKLEKKPLALELYNRHDTCPSQLLRCLSDAARYYGLNITLAQLNKYRPGLEKLLINRFGSFNKAKQLLRLAINARGSKVEYDKMLILNDICCFYSIHGRWPVNRDYWGGEMICSRAYLQKFGGLIALRQEAMKLRKEQEERRIKGEQVVQIANDIERDNMGHARR